MVVVTEWWHIRAGARTCKQGFQGPLLPRGNRRAPCCPRANGAANRQRGSDAEGRSPGLVGRQLCTSTSMSWGDSMGGFQPLVRRSHPPALSTVCLSLEGHSFFFCLDLKDLEQLRLPNVSQLVWRNSLGCQTCGNPRPFLCADGSTEHMQESSMLPKPCGAHGGCTLWCLYAQTSLGSPDHKHEVSLSPSLIKPR